MSYQVFARKYRPRTFNDVLGQDHVVRTLRNAIEQNRLAHAYLFVGPRGTGKTSTARIFAKALNCEGGPRVDFDPDEEACREIEEGRSLDVEEIDGASNRGIDNIRDLRDNVQFAPTRGKYRIIYIDEVHMLTKESFNALLKTLEEPPSHVMFIFATTEPHKILPTILSRCQRFDLRPIPADIIARHLVHIAGLEGVTLTESAAAAIARVADGGMRDAQSMLDQLVSFCGNHIEEHHVNEIFGVTSRETVAKALAYILDRQLPSLLHLVHELSEAGRDMGQLLSEVMGAVRELLISKVAPDEAASSLPEPWRGTLQGLLACTPADKIVRLMEVLSSTEERMRWSTNKRLHLEMGLIQAVHSLAEANISDIIRALNGAPLPDMPIATSVLPEVAMPAAAPVSATPAAAPVPAPSAPAKPGLEPIDDQPPSFAAASGAPAPEPAAEEEEGLPAEEDAAGDFMPGFGDFVPSASAMDEEEMPERPITPEDWDAALDAARKQSPLGAGVIGNTVFISEEEGVVVIAIHPTDTESRDALLSEEVQELLNTTLEARCGHGLRVLRVVTDATVPPPAMVEPPPPLPPPPAPAPRKPAAEKPAAEKPAAPPPAESLRPTEEEFYHDPLIELALKEFHATLIKS